MAAVAEILNVENTQGLEPHTSPSLEKYNNQDEVLDMLADMPHNSFIYTEAPWRIVRDGPGKGSIILDRFLTTPLRDGVMASLRTTQIIGVVSHPDMPWLQTNTGYEAAVQVHDVSKGDERQWSAWRAENIFDRIMREKIEAERALQEAGQTSNQ